MKLTESSKANEFTPHLKDALVSILSRFQCIKIPSPSNLTALLLEVASHEIVPVPMKVLQYMNLGVPVSHPQFWDDFSVQELYDVFCGINATPAQLIRSIACKPEELNPAQVSIFGFLLSFIGNNYDM